MTSAPASPMPRPTPPAYRPNPEPADTRGPLLLAVAVSILLHAVLAFAVYRKPIGSIDPSLLSLDRVFRVKRAAADAIIDDQGPGGGPAIAPLTPTEAANTASLAELSRILLEGTPPPPTDIAITPPKTLDKTTIETRPDVDKPIASATSGTGKLPSEILDALRTGPAVDLPFVPGSQAGDGGVPGTGTGNNGGKTVAAPQTGAKPIEPFEYGAQRAREALEDAGFAQPIDSRPPPLQAPSFDKTVSDPLPDRALARGPINSPGIDFAALALEDTKSLPLPEHLDDDFDYVVTRFKPAPEQVGFLGLGGTVQDPNEYFRVDIRARRSLNKLKSMPKDVVYLIDTSGSVSQDWVNNAVFGVRDALGSLNQGDRFNIVFFNETPAFFSPEQSVAADDDSIRKAQQFLVSAKSEGFTDVNRALSRLLVRDQAAERVYYLIFISDGVPTRGVMDTREVINLITRDNDLAASIYCVGIGGRQNRELLNFLAYRNKGFSVFADAAPDASSAIRDLGSRLRYPIIKNVKLSLVGMDMNEVFPHDMPNIHQGEAFSLFGRFQQAGPFTARLSGISSGAKVDFTFTRDLTQAPQGEKNMPQLWAFWKLHHLYSELIRKGETPEIRKQIDEIREQYKLKTLY